MSFLSVKSYLESLTLVLLPTRAFCDDSKGRVLLRVAWAEGFPDHRHGAPCGHSLWHSLRHSPRTLQGSCLRFWVAHLANTNSTNHVHQVRGPHHAEPKGWKQSEPKSQAFRESTSAERSCKSLKSYARFRLVGWVLWVQNVKVGPFQKYQQLLLSTLRPDHVLQVAVCRGGQRKTTGTPAERHQHSHEETRFKQKDSIERGQGINISRGLFTAQWQTMGVLH